MSVCIKDYCKTNDNVLAKGLKTLDDKSIVLDTTQLEVYFRDGEYWCRLFFDYTLSCNDLAVIASVFSGYWWCVSPSILDTSLILSINFKDQTL